MQFSRSMHRLCPTVSAAARSRVGSGLAQESRVRV
ncbi:hypothetical protein SAMN05421819_4053 [Bryocella elongata]|uniref:Uncharacterized protein n=1 Tax=Bryocella elongata TaxID=863522 RepID=A0A1H6BYA0_9BACT|nr:hypothetical protein SAMN05421819_4053 [Bryocella elongata]